MRSVFTRLRYSGAFLALIVILLAPVAAAGQRSGGPWWANAFQNTKRLIVTVLGRLTPPPGEPVGDTTLKAPSDASVTLKQ